MSDLVSLEWPREGVALVTLTNPDINNHGSWEGVEQLADALQRLFQTVVGTPEAIEKMGELQDRFDTGAAPRDVYGDARD